MVLSYLCHIWNGDFWRNVVAQSKTVCYVRSWRSWTTSLYSVHILIILFYIIQPYEYICLLALFMFLPNAFPMTVNYSILGFVITSEEKPDGVVQPCHFPIVRLTGTIILFSVIVTYKQCLYFRQSKCNHQSSQTHEADFFLSSWQSLSFSRNSFLFIVPKIHCHAQKVQSTIWMRSSVRFLLTVHSKLCLFSQMISLIRYL